MQTIDKKITSLIKQLKIEKMEHYKSEKFYFLLTKLEETCPHNKGRTTGTYWNDGNEYCYICGNNKGASWNDNLNN